MSENKPLLTIAALEEALRDTSNPVGERRLEMLKLLQELGLYEEEKENSKDARDFYMVWKGNNKYELWCNGKYIETYDSYAEALRAGNDACNKKELINEKEKRMKEEENAESPWGFRIVLGANNGYELWFKEKHVQTYESYDKALIVGHGIRIYKKLMDDK